MAAPVIPAHAGIQVSLAQVILSGVEGDLELDSSLRWDDLRLGPRFHGDDLE
ncbi:MAG: hypothetical protein P1R58_03720 [bacterium]|nr:hypothetical protein [bacterium]